MRYLWLLVLVTVYDYSFSQGNIQVSYQENSKGYYSFYCTNGEYCNYTLDIYFDEIMNLKSSVPLPFRTQVHPGSNFLFVLERINRDMGSSFKYHTRFFKGCVNPEIDQDFSYLLPVGNGKTTLPFRIDLFRISDWNSDPKDFFMIGFKLNSGDTICAARRGVVTSVRDTANLGLSGYTYSSGDNYIEICHKDCSFGFYHVLKKSLVRIGQEVGAGDPIAIAGGEKYSIGTQVRFCVSYIYEPDLQATKKDGSTYKKYRAYVPLVFHTREENTSRLSYNREYTSDHPDSLIIREMTKSQVKKWLINQTQ